MLNHIQHINEEDLNLLDEQLNNENDLNEQNEEDNNLEDEPIDLVNNTGVIHLNNINLREQVDSDLEQQNQNEIPLVDFPILQPGPINELTPGYIALAFPCLILKGN